MRVSAAEMAARPALREAADPGISTGAGPIRGRKRCARARRCSGRRRALSAAAVQGLAAILAVAGIASDNRTHSPALFVKCRARRSNPYPIHGGLS